MEQYISWCSYTSCPWVFLSPWAFQMPWPQNTATTMEVLATSDIFHPPPGNHKYDTQCINPGICVSCISSYLHPCSLGQGGARTGQWGDGSKHRGVINNFCLFPSVANNLLGVGIFIWLVIGMGNLKISSPKQPVCLHLSSWAALHTGWNYLVTQSWWTGKSLMVV